MNYRDWVGSNEDARIEMQELWDQSKTIKNKAFRNKFLRDCKHDFTCKWTNLYIHYKEGGSHEKDKSI